MTTPPTGEVLLNLWDNVGTLFTNGLTPGQSDRRVELTTKQFLRLLQVLPSIPELTALMLFLQAAQPVQRDGGVSLVVPGFKGEWVRERSDLGRDRAFKAVRNLRIKGLITIEDEPGFEGIMTHPGWGCLVGPRFGLPTAHGRVRALSGTGQSKTSQWRRKNSGRAAEPTVPVTVPVTQPVTVPVTQPVTQPVTVPVTQPVTQPVTEPEITGPEPEPQTGQPESPDSGIRNGTTASDVTQPLSGDGSRVPDSGQSGNRNSPRIAGGVPVSGVPGIRNTTATSSSSAAVQSTTTHSPSALLGAESGTGTASLAWLQRSDRVALLAGDPHAAAERLAAFLRRSQIDAQLCRSAATAMGADGIAADPLLAICRYLVSLRLADPNQPHIAGGIRAHLSTLGASVPGQPDQDLLTRVFLAVLLSLVQTKPIRSWGGWFGRLLKPSYVWEFSGPFAAALRALDGEDAISEQHASDWLTGLWANAEPGSNTSTTPGSPPGSSAGPRPVTAAGHADQPDGDDALLKAICDASPYRYRDVLSNPRLRKAVWDGYQAGEFLPADDDSISLGIARQSPP